jgi:4-hydroxythreonine-4-phosphate dehydrogenase
VTLPILITPGDPTGVGPEVVSQWLHERGPSARPLVVVGDQAALSRCEARFGWALPPDVRRVEPPPGEPVEVAALRWSVGEILAGRASALVTGPIHKASLAARGFPHPGHTEFLGELCGVERPVMAFTGGRVRVALVTVHLPLRAVPDAITVEGVVHVGRTADAALRRWLGLSRPRLWVCGLNPHAGDAGLLGTEETDCVAPAVAALRASGVDAVGPISAEAAFVKAARGEGDLVIAMYHDQGLVPLKALDFGRTVNWTLGLPIIRTSVDHGTAHDIAGQGVADPASFGAALALASSLVDRATSP